MSSRGSIRAKKAATAWARGGKPCPTRIGRAFPKAGSPSFYEPLPDPSPVRAHRRELQEYAREVESRNTVPVVVHPLTDEQRKSFEDEGMEVVEELDGVVVVAPKQRPRRPMSLAAIAMLLGVGALSALEEKH